MIAFLICFCILHFYQQINLAFKQKVKKSLKELYKINRLRIQEISISEWIMFVITAYIELNLRT